MFTKLCLILTIIGGLNWGLVGFFNFNLVDAIFGNLFYLDRLTYMIVGLAALWVAFDSAHVISKKNS